MDESTNKIKSIKDRIDPYVWLVGSVLVPVIVASWTAWNTIISPAIVKFEDTLTSKISNPDKRSNIAFSAVNDRP